MHMNSPSYRAPHRGVALALAFASMAIVSGGISAIAVAGEKAALPDPVGRWAGPRVRKLKVARIGGRKLRRAPDDDVTVETLLRVVIEDGGAWTSSDGAGGYRGSYATVGKRLVLTYDAASRAVLEGELATRVEAMAASAGLTIDASVAITGMRVTAKAKDSRKKGSTVKVRERHAFTVTTTGDVSETRKGVFRRRGALVPDTSEPAPLRRVSPLEMDAPYIGDPEAFWARSDLYVMTPDVLPANLWPDEVLFPSTFGIKIIVLLPGDYRQRSTGRLPPGTLYIAESGTEAEPLLVTYAPYVGADLRETPHPAERLGEGQAQLIAFRIWNQKYQYLRGLTFADGVSACFLHTATDNVIDRCLWHETGAQPLRIRFNSLRNLVQRCVMRRFQPERWGGGDTVAIQLSDETLTDNRIVSNVILNYTDSYQHTDRVGDEYGLGAGTIIDNNFMGFTSEAYLDDPAGELMCGENSIDMKMGGTQESPVRITNNVFFGTRAAKAGCAASGSGGYAVAFHRRGTWIEMTDNLFVDMDSGIFLNAFFLNVDASQGRIDPKLTLTGNTFSGIKSFATAFPSRTGRVLSGASAATFTGNRIVRSERLMEQEPFPGPWELVIDDNVVYGPLDLAPRDESRMISDGNEFLPPDDVVETVLQIPWSSRTLTYAAPR